MSTYNGFYIGTGIILNLAALFGGVTLYLNDKLRSDIKKLKEDKTEKEYLKKIHSNSASRYDKFYGRVEVRNKINGYRKILTSYSEGRVLETGCGTGRNFCFYKNNQNVIAVDYSDEKLGIASQKLANKEHKNNEGILPFSITSNIDLQHTDCENLVEEFGENSFDSVVDMMNMQAYANPDKVLEQIKKVTKNNGKIIILTRGQSTNFLINYFYKVYFPTVYMRYGVDYSRNWDEYFSSKNIILEKSNS
jgi:ubiquinone/menaquinone biosynthesis C-methylase UbiE